jgi:hypothetical protein
MDNSINLIVEADEPALFYHSIEDAEMDLEPYDVIDGVYKSIFGPNGEIYNISSEGHVVKIERLVGACDKNKLISVVKNFLVSIGKIEESDDSISLGDMLIECVPFIREL